MENGDRSLIGDDFDRQYTNAFLLIHSSNHEPPQTLGADVLKNRDFRSFNRARAAITASGSQITNVRFLNPVTQLGNTIDACNSSFTTVANLLWGVLKPEAHSDNGKNGVTPNQLHVFQLNEGRVGKDAQAVNMTLNACTSTDAAGMCNAPISPVTPYIWSYPLFNSQGQYSVNTQIFPTYYVYENGSLVSKIPQSALETFIGLNSSSQVQANGIQ
jgi:hypothetical protein